MTTINVRNRLFALLPGREKTKGVVAHDLGICERTLDYIRCQDYTPDLALAHKISDYFGLPLDHVFWRYPPRIFPNAQSPLATVPVESAALGELQLYLWKQVSWLERAGLSLGPYDALSLADTTERLNQHLASSVEDAHHRQPLSSAHFDSNSLFDARVRLQSQVADEIADPTAVYAQLLVEGLARSLEVVHEANLTNAKNAEEMILASNQNSGR